MRKSLHVGLAVLGAATLTLGLTAPATAITGGDADGNGHPNVGLISFYEDGGRYRCTATLVNPTTLITAAHCVATDGLTAVTFKSEQAVLPPSGLPLAADPAKGYTEADIKATPGFYAGKAIAHPAYSNFTDLANWNDVAVVKFDKPDRGHHAGDDRPQELPQRLLAAGAQQDAVRARRLRHRGAQARRRSRRSRRRRATRSSGAWPTPPARSSRRRSCR